MSPFHTLMFSQSKYLPSHTSVNVRKENKNEKKVESKKWKIIKQRKDNSATACSLPVRSEGFPRHFYAGPEEEVFSMSLESPSVPLMSCSFHWEDLNRGSPKLSTIITKTPCPTGTTSALELDSGHEKELPVTPVVSPCAASPSNQVAPPRHKRVGRSSVLIRYVHKYECEDFMEYAVDIYGWKKSLEENYQVGDWEPVQSEVTPRMRYTLLEWLVNITRQLEFSLETWCLAANYLDRFLAAQLLAKDCLQLVGLTAMWVAAKQEELAPPSLDELVALCAATYTAINFKHMELILLAKLQFNLAAPTAAYHLSHLVAVEDEKEWPEDLSRHLVEMVMEDHLLARLHPSRIARSVFKVVKGCDVTSIRVLEGSCPKCEPHNSDQWCRDFLHACLQRVADILSV